MKSFNDGGPLSRIKLLFRSSEAEGKILLAARARDQRARAERERGPDGAEISDEDRERAAEESCENTGTSEGRFANSPPNARRQANLLARSNPR